MKCEQAELAAQLPTLSKDPPSTQRGPACPAWYPLLQLTGRIAVQPLGELAHKHGDALILVLA